MRQQIDLREPVRPFIAVRQGADYELRLLDSRGATVRIYRAHHAGAEDAKRMLLDIRNVDYQRYELWCGMAKIDEGPALIVR